MNPLTEDSSVPVASAQMEVPEKPNPLFVVTPLSKYLALALFIVLPFIGYYVGMRVAPERVNYVEVPAVPVVVATTTPIVAPDTNAPLYQNAALGISFAYPAHKVVQPIPSKMIGEMGDTTTVSYPSDWVEVPGVFIVAKIPYADIGGAASLTSDKVIVDYDSCCSGTKYGFNTKTMSWEAFVIAQDLSPAEIAEGAKQLPVGKRNGDTKPLSGEGVCMIDRTLGNHTYYRIKSGDEGQATDYYYFLMTDKGYAIRFDSKIDLDDGAYAMYPADSRPTDTAIETVKKLLASVTLTGEAKEIIVGCK